MKLRIVVLLVLVLAGGAIAVDRVSPAEPVARSAVSLSPAAGVLSCPYVTEPTGRAYVQLANVGSSTAAVRLGIGAAIGNASLPQAENGAVARTHSQPMARIDAAGRSS